VTNTLSTTRRCLHGVAELVLAGPQYRRSATIRLRAVPGGFATVSEPSLQVVDGRLVATTGSVPVDSHSCADLAAVAGFDVGAPAGLYDGGSGVDPAEVLTLDAGSAALITAGFSTGDAALRIFAPTQTPVLWPEHFDLGVQLDEVNYGVSAGDTYLDEPYAYVGPWKPREGDFWNAPFGATRPMRDLPDPQALAAFFAEGQTQAHL
jgi:hypothetical protein